MIILKIFVDDKKVAQEKIPDGGIIEAEILGGKDVDETATILLKEAYDFIREKVRYLINEKEDVITNTIKYQALNDRKAQFETNWPKKSDIIEVIDVIEEGRIK